MLDKIIEIVPFVLAVAVSAGGFIFTQYHKRLERKADNESVGSSKSK